MQEYKDKSDTSIKASSLLIDNGLYSPSVHCSYYSCIQAMICAYCKYNRLSYEVYKQIYDKQNTGFHGWIISELKRDINTHRSLGMQKRKIAVLEFNEAIVQLKDKRVEADYDNTVIDEETAINAKKTAEEVLAMIQKIFMI